MTRFLSTLATLLLFVLCAVPQATRETVFVGLPTMRLTADGEVNSMVRLSAKEAAEFECRIVQESGRYFWASRENKELEVSSSGIFVFFCTKDGSGLIKITTNSQLALSEFDYFEHLSLGMRTITYWGTANQSIEEYLRRLEKSSIGKKALESGKSLQSLQQILPAMKQLNDASREFFGAYAELNIEASANPPNTDGALERIRRMSVAADALATAAQGYEVNLNHFVATKQVEFNQAQITNFKASSQMLARLAATGKKLSAAAAVYVATLSEDDRANYKKQTEEFDEQSKAVFGKGRQNLDRLDQLIDEK